MQTKRVLYAAVGAPVVTVKSVQSRLGELRGRISKEAQTFGKQAQGRLDDWAKEGEQVVTRITDGKVVDELTSKVDFDQVQEQVGRLRDQLEDMLATWRSSFRPGEQPAARESARGAAQAAEAPAPKTAPAKKAPAKKAPAKKATTSRSPAAKRATAKAAPAKAEAKAS
ncbi:MAG: hypothetical protein ACRDVM_10665 [Acidimicrobiia bacterium]